MSAAYAPPAAGDPIVAVVLVVALHRSHTGIKRYVRRSTPITLFENAYMFAHVTARMLY